MRKSLSLFVGLLFTASFHPTLALSAQDYYVTDELKIFMHRGPSNGYKIKSRLTAGTSLTLLERNKGTGYVHVRTVKGTQGWIDGKYLKVGEGVIARLPKVENELKNTQQQLAEEQQRVSTLSQQLQQLNSSRKKEVLQLNEARTQTTAQVAQLENELVRLQTDIDGMDQTNLMGWFLRGGGVALAGIIIGLLIPKLPKRRRRTEDWF